MIEARRDDATGELSAPPLHGVTHRDDLPQAALRVVRSRALDVGPHGLYRLVETQGHEVGAHVADPSSSSS